ncbi:MAG: hypothetical protein JWM68_5760 [Verrucomicrobiales bacterium]|nr:hypothetical protein [Verrucomicrobiales bacterium]
MPFDANCTGYMGKRLFVLPYYANGWGFEDGNSTSVPTESIGPAPFDMVLTEFVYRQAQIVGAVGRIQGPQHKYDGKWVAFCLRFLGNCNFTTSLGHSMIWIARDKPVAKADSSDAVYYWIEMENAPPKLVGYGDVSESKEWVKELYERTIKTRKDVMG